jgi:hypothetical protein
MKTQSLLSRFVTLLILVVMFLPLTVPASGQGLAQPGALVAGWSEGSLLTGSHTNSPTDTVQVAITEGGLDPRSVFVETEWDGVLRGRYQPGGQLS